MFVPSKMLYHQTIYQICNATKLTIKHIWTDAQVYTSDKTYMANRLQSVNGDFHFYLLLIKYHTFLL